MYNSTRNKEKKYNASEVIIKGISDDGGLFVTDIVDISDRLLEFSSLNYYDLTTKILSLYYNDFNQEEIREIVRKVYREKFNDDNVIKLKKIDSFYMLELFHGPTMAFKDIALTLLPHFINLSKKKNYVNSKVLILVATSGDTGKASLEAFKDVSDLFITILYPNEGVSEFQKLQMITQKGENVNVLAIDGNFDDAQKKVKEIFLDDDLKDFMKKKNIIFSSSNSINIARLIPQVPYYFYAYFELLKKGEISIGEKINISVPTGNFGNILAGYIAKKMGLPIDKLIVASNDNDILTEFFKTGIYDLKREFKTTISPSMDILLSSNLERLIYYLTDESIVRDKYKELSETKEFKLDTKLLKDFLAYSVDEKECATSIKEVYNNYNYLMDTHTAVGYKAYKKSKEDKKTIILSTASPYKFSKAVLKAIDKYKKRDDLSLIKELAKYTDLKLSDSMIEMFNDKVRFTKVVKVEKVKEELKKWLK